MEGKTGKGKKGYIHHHLIVIYFLSYHDHHDDGMMLQKGRKDAERALEDRTGQLSRMEERMVQREEEVMVVMVIMVQRGW